MLSPPTTRERGRKGRKWREGKGEGRREGGKREAGGRERGREVKL